MASSAALLAEQFLFPRFSSAIPSKVTCAWVSTPTRIGPWLIVEAKVLDATGHLQLRRCRLNELLLDFVSNYVYRLNRAIDRRRWDAIDGIKEQALNDVLPVYDQIPDKVCDQVAAMTLIMEYVRTIELLHHAAIRAESCPGAIRLSRSTSGPLYRYDPSTDAHRTIRQKHIHPTPYCYYDHSRRIFSHQRQNAGQPPVNGTATPEQIANIFRTTSTALMRQLGFCMAEIRDHLSTAGFGSDDLSAVLAQ